MGRFTHYVSKMADVTIFSSKFQDEQKEFKQASWSTLIYPVECTYKRFNRYNRSELVSAISYRHNRIEIKSKVSRTFVRDLLKSADIPVSHEIKPVYNVPISGVDILNSYPPITVGHPATIRITNLKGKIITTIVCDPNRF